MRKASEVAADVFKSEHKFRAVMNRNGPGGEEVVTADRLALVERLREMARDSLSSGGAHIVFELCDEITHEIHAAASTKEDERDG